MQSHHRKRGIVKKKFREHTLDEVQDEKGWSSAKYYFNSTKVYLPMVKGYNS
jgi:hypothetical protein